MNKKTFLLFTVISLIFFSCDSNQDELDPINSDCIGDYSTAGILVDINEQIYNDDESVNNYSFKWL